MDSTLNENYTLKFEERPGYLYAFIKADTMNREIALSYLGQISAVCKEKKIKKLLVERDVPVMLPDGDLFFTTNDFANMMKGVRVAFFNPHITIADHMKFAVLIGTNRGARFTVHHNFGNAESWLLDPAAFE